MESLGKDQASADSSLPPSAAYEENAVPGATTIHRLRDRELLRKRKAEAMEKDSAQWILRMHNNRQQRRGRRAKRARRRQPVVKAVLDEEPTIDPHPDVQKEAEPVHSEPALPEPAYQEQLPMLTIQNLVSEMPPVAAEAEPAVRSLDPAGEEEVLKPVEADILEDLGAPLENDHQDNEFNIQVLY